MAAQFSFAQRLGDLPEPGNLELRLEVRERLQGKSPLVEPRVRDAEAGLVDHLVRVDE